MLLSPISACWTAVSQIVATSAWLADFCASDAMQAPRFSAVQLAETSLRASAPVFFSLRASAASPAVITKRLPLSQSTSHTGAPLVLLSGDTAPEVTLSQFVLSAVA